MRVPASGVWPGVAVRPGVDRALHPKSGKEAAPRAAWLLRKRNSLRRILNMPQYLRGEPRNGIHSKTAGSSIHATEATSNSSRCMPQIRSRVKRSASKPSGRTTSRAEERTPIGVTANRECRQASILELVSFWSSRIDDAAPRAMVRPRSVRRSAALSHPSAEGTS
jgi:hypothetical protein